MRNVIFLLTLNLSIFLSLSASYGQTIAGFVNEVNYLASNPADRGLEIAGEAGSDLNGWSVVIYLADGTVDYVRYLYNGVIPSQQNGYGTVWVEMEQGSGDGFALVDANNNVVQFVSYGTATYLTAVEGAANGLTAEFIGVQLLPEDALQLTGTGLAYVDFLWSIPAGVTPDEVNTNQVLGLLPPVGLQTNNGSGAVQLFGNQSVANKIPVADPVITTYPNPTTDRLFVEWDTPQAEGEMAIFNLNGQRLFTQVIPEGKTVNTVDIAHLPAGQYLLFVRADTYSTTRMIVKQ